MKERSEGERYNRYSDEWLIDRYFKYGSVEEALSNTKESVPFSFADMHRKLESAGIVKSAGRQTSFSEALHFFRQKQMEPGTPLESLYKSMPLSFKTSMETLHRIYNRMVEVKQSSVVSRYATALVVTKEATPDQILVAHESSSREKYGKVAGQLSLPMTFSRATDTPIQRIVRVLQQEVVTDDAIGKRFIDTKYLESILSGIHGPYLIYRLLDVEITCYGITLPETISCFSSYKLSEHQYIPAQIIVNSDEKDFRIGVPEMVKEYCNQTALQEVPVITSDFNLAIAAVPNRKSA